MDVGGQAVVEGVMMRNKEKYAVAVRLPNGKIKVKKEASTTFPKFFNVFFIRGIIGMGYMLIDGIKAITWSSNQQLEKDEKMTKMEIALTVILSFLFSIAVFVAIPFFSAKYIHSEGMWFNILDGIFRGAVFIGYLLIISMMKDVKTLFKYHGAEHKTIFCYESGKSLTLQNVKKFSRFHPRCGTSFLFLVVIISIFVYSFIPGSLVSKFVGRILLLPVIAGIGYELIKLSGKFQNNAFVKVITAPGLWLQRLTTGEPSDKQIEVGIAALKGVVG